MAVTFLFLKISRWKQYFKDDKEQWIGVFSKRVWILQQQDSCILYKVFENDLEVRQSEEFYNKLLLKYFQLDLNLQDYYDHWGKQDPYFKDAAKRFYGIRILNQDVVENIFSFICSQNNHISRITHMVQKLSEFYGSKICDIDGEAYYSFPDVQALAQDSVEQKLRACRFGYRSKYINNSAKLILSEGGDKWINDLQSLNYGSAKKKLMTLAGIGAKVADCICLMSLGHLEAIPVDTHIFQIAASLYMPELATQKTVTQKIYNAIGDHFRELYGPLAGWAHTVLFCADLKKFHIPKSTLGCQETKKNKRQKSV
ncbi:N-glycosylase/DNA lyase isoform X2 [Cylas formicarius]|uniref:N-glycosylase/DNA lyase isoform X2 n=1 Tax=Cylas formicarius TaxID=197179 RepID=UPI0029585785|nr:N-glycosylase/DNA lyase isoform X2 [Cylas formicarius]